MNALPEPLRQVGRDLVDKKLWPIAVLLLAAIVAGPLLIGGSSGDPGAPPAPVAAVAPGADSESLIKVVDQAVTGKERPGDIENPIYDPPDPEEPASGGAAETPATGGTATSAPGADPTVTPEKPISPPDGPTNTPPAEPAPSVSSATHGVHHRTVARWYTDDAGKPRPITRLTPFGSRADAVALYLGVTRSKAGYAVFLLGSHATSEGDAKCEDDDCRVIGLKAGDKQTVTYQPPSGEVLRYHLEVVSVKTITTDAAQAREMRAKVHPEGREVMRAMW
ncbi:MAG TPA: hypothetical protein VGV67_06410, partial [Solirubrobacteraceae bacterium]|nr:hypothetical protein [Solirubrobacteraceae bacterium]